MTPYTNTIIDICAEAWEKHSQRIHIKWPMGFGGHAALQSPARLMCESAFIYAFQELLTTLRTSEDVPTSVRIADATVVSDIECNGVGTTIDGQRWYDVRAMLDPREQCDESIDMTRQAMDYALRRGLVVAHHEHKHLLRVVRFPA